MILIIDDDAAVRDMLCECLGDFGYDTAVAKDGLDGLQRMERRPQPHLVIADIIMPQKEGLETIIEIRRSWPEVKVLAISGGGRMKSGDFLLMAEKLGAHAILRKPIHIPELESVVARLVGQ